jgi:hypothetical protein
MKPKPRVRAKRKTTRQPLASPRPAAGRPRVIGLGRFASGVLDLGSNKKHLRGFGS